MKLSDAIAKYLSENNINTVFGYQGGSITHMIDSFDRYHISYIQTYNEQGASLAADAFSRIKNDSIGVAIGTNGPGATNMVTGIANAYCDSVPVLFFTGQVHTFAMKKSNTIRQESFQEIDIVSIVKPITKYAKTIMDKDEALLEIAKAIEIAKSDRPGPVLIDLPVDIQGQDVEYVVPDIKPSSSEPSPIDINGVIEALCVAKKPIILAGGGIRLSNECQLFRDLIDSLKIPVVVSLMGLDTISHDNPNFVGFIGTYGNRYANIALQEADLILVLGSRLDMRQTGKRKDLFAPNAKIVHIDIDEYEHGHRVKADISITCDVGEFIRRLYDASNQSGLSLEIKEWHDRINSLKQMYDDEEEQESQIGLNPNSVVKRIANRLTNHIVCADVGQNQMWLAQSYRSIDKECRILNSGGLGTMGFSLPAAVGACYANRDKKVAAFMGDGGLQMNIQELQLVGENHLPMKIIVFNNHALGLIRDIQEKYYEKNYIGSVRGFSVPALDKLASAYQMNYYKISKLEDVDEIDWTRDESAIIEVEFLQNTYVKPELLGNDPLDRQIPYKTIEE